MIDDYLPLLPSAVINTMKSTGGGRVYFTSQVQSPSGGVKAGTEADCGGHSLLACSRGLLSSLSF